MRRLTTTAILACFLLNLQAQVTFNKRQRYNFEAAVMTSVLPTDSCYYVAGIIADTVFPFNTGNIFAKLDLEGETVFIKTLESTEKTYETWEHTLFPLQDSGFVLSGYSYDSTMKALLLKFDPFGDTVSVHEYLNPLYPLFDFIRPRAFAPAGPDGFVFACQVEAFGAAGNSNSDIFVFKVSDDGEIIWQKSIGDTNWDVPHSVLVDGNGNITIGARLSNTNLVTQNYTYRTHLISLDSLGNENWAYLTPTSLGLRDAANDMVLLEDGSLVIASGVGHEIDRPSVNVVWFDRHIFKLNPQREIEWELTFPDAELNGHAKTTKLVQLSDGSGYVMTSALHEPNPSPGVNFTIHGWLGKVSPGGDSVWTRRYAYLTDTESEHKIYDMKETPDGGLILCGESFDWGDGATYPQQAWLLKLDAHGCLIPGCHLLDAAGETEVPKMQLAIYPNPTADYLNFQLRGGNVGRVASFRIVDLQGRVLRTFESGTPAATHMVPVWDWGAGVYFLQFVEEGVPLATERFVVTK